MSSPKRGAVRPLAMAVTVARRQAQGSMAFFLQVSTRKAMRAQARPPF